MDSSSQKLVVTYSYLFRSYSFEEYYEVFSMLYDLVGASALKDAYKLALTAQAFFAGQELIQMYLLAMFCFKNLDIVKLDFHTYEDNQEVAYILMVLCQIFTFIFIFTFLFIFVYLFIFLFLFTFILSVINSFIWIFKFAHVFSIFKSIFYFNAFNQIFNFYFLKRVKLVNIIIIIAFVSQF